MHKLRLIVAFIIPFSLFLTACKDKTIGGNGIVKEKRYSLSAFNTLSLKGAFEIHLYPSNNYEVRVVADENLIPEIRVEVSDSTLEVAPQKNIIRSRELKLYIGCPAIRSIILSGASEVMTDTIIQSSQLNISISGTGKLVLNLKVSTLNLNISGGADVTLQGNASQMNNSITGIGKIDAQNFTVETATIEISGYGYTYVNASRLLNINVSGFGKIFYTGNPTIKQNITGSAKIKQKQQNHGGA